MAFWFFLPAPLLYFTLAIVLYLTVLELRQVKPHWKWWVWSLSFVGLMHFIGYLAIRGFIAYRRGHRAGV